MTIRTGWGAGLKVQLEAAQDLATVQQVDENFAVLYPYERADLHRSKTVPSQLTFQQLYDFGEISAGQLLPFFNVTPQ